MFNLSTLDIYFDVYSRFYVYSRNHNFRMSVVYRPPPLSVSTAQFHWGVFSTFSNISCNIRRTFHHRRFQHPCRQSEQCGHAEVPKLSWWVWYKTTCCWHKPRQGSNGQRSHRKTYYKYQFCFNIFSTMFIYIWLFVSMFILYIASFCTKTIFVCINYITKLELELCPQTMSA